MKRLMFIWFSLLVTFNVQANEVANVNKAAEQYFAAVKVFDTLKMTNMLHPEALAQFKATFEQVFKGSKSQKAQSDLLPLFSVSKLEEFNGLSNSDAYKRFNDFLVAIQPQMLSMMEAATFTIKSTSIEEGIGHVNYTLTMNTAGQSADTDVVQKFKLQEGRWLAMLPPSAAATMAGIKTQYK